MSPSGGQTGDKDRGVLINHFFDFIIDNVRNNQVRITNINLLLTQLIYTKNTGRFKMYCV